MEEKMMIKTQTSERIELDVLPQRADIPPPLPTYDDDNDDDDNDDDDNDDDDNDDNENLKLKRIEIFDFRFVVLESGHKLGSHSKPMKLVICTSNFLRRAQTLKEN